MDRFDQLRTFVRVVDLVAEEVDVALRVGKVGRFSLSGRPRDWSRRAHVRADA